VGPYRNADDDARPRTLPRRPGWLAFGDVLLGLLVAVSVVIAVLMLAVSR
jgi:hypothetical protein